MSKLAAFCIATLALACMSQECFTHEYSDDCLTFGSLTNISYMLPAGWNQTVVQEYLYFMDERADELADEMIANATAEGRPVKDPVLCKKEIVQRECVPRNLKPCSGSSPMFQECMGSCINYGMACGGVSRANATRQCTAIGAVSDGECLGERQPSLQ